MKTTGKLKTKPKVRAQTAKKKGEPDALEALNEALAAPPDPDDKTFPTEDDYDGVAEAELAEEESAVPSPVGAEATEPRPLTELAADPMNPRTISGDALVGLGNSMEDYGDLSGIVLNRRTGQLVCGHQRVTALARAGASGWFEAGPDRGAIRHPLTGEVFPVRLVDWDPDKQRRANLIANSPALAGEFTAEALAQLAAMEHDAHFSALRLDELERELAARFEKSGPSTDEPPSDFPNADANAAAHYRCPSCQYEWNGEPRP